MSELKSKREALIGPLSVGEVLDAAANIVAERFISSDVYSSADKVKEYLKFKLVPYEREVFGVMFLTSQHALIDFEELFFGTVNMTTVYPREIVKAALKNNAAAVILAHNHPSGEPEPSQADRNITQRIQQALSLVDIDVLDHIIVGKESMSFAERGLI
ncbi:RadC family protein [Echinimonas agarilytica]|uniref:DNA repair protein RadC n=1 Tax=Echinimonas agarilytica TaxID=1215918 RepID=A0AA42B994_9GAMM|nr:DNA repair protein RadC [Echinimonas agarilytica]MCM2680966.1 DNA repair protein RadC [Echinimonas agarilytica]